MRIDDLARRAGFSQSALERRFRREVGPSPKKFAGIVRLRNVVRLRRTGASFTEIAPPRVTPTNRISSRFQALRRAGSRAVFPIRNSILLEPAKNSAYTPNLYNSEPLPTAYIGESTHRGEARSSHPNFPLGDEEQ